MMSAAAFRLHSLSTATSAVHGRPGLVPDSYLAGLTDDDLGHPVADSVSLRPIARPASGNPSPAAIACSTPKRSRVPTESASCGKKTRGMRTAPGRASRIPGEPSPARWVQRGRPGSGTETGEARRAKLQLRAMRQPRRRGPRRAGESRCRHAAAARPGAQCRRAGPRVLPWHFLARRRGRDPGRSAGAHRTGKRRPDRHTGDQRVSVGGNAVLLPGVRTQLLQRRLGHLRRLQHRVLGLHHRNLPERAPAPRRLTNFRTWPGPCRCRDLQG